ncbi:hypothetical protein [Sagittula sp. MA-2]|jgi:hypothetical protein|uniref:hypothetical protein n=1 Tax=Sagittula sp. MA-2 TaxID=3048007 RepID=UPI0024C2D089|nr:hypothetical protein [Sagittula sp. MA-2]WHZ35755.1 hypothetical protein QNI11_01830 [Sagittula sp. MA-2]
MRLIFAALLVATGASAQTPDEITDAKSSIAGIAECQMKLLDWNSGNRRPLMRKYGKFADEVVGACGIVIRANRQLLDDFNAKYPDAMAPVSRDPKP